MPKVWLVLFIGYEGAPFNGMQFQIEQHVTAVEDMLVEKMHARELLPTDHHGQLEKQWKWSRAARTDRGVHAVINGVSCLFTVPQQFYEEGTLNHNRLHLEFKEAFEGTPITYHCFRRVTTRFELRKLVHTRQYCYICPKMFFMKEERKESARRQMVEEQPQGRLENTSKEESTFKPIDRQPASDAKIWKCEGRQADQVNEMIEKVAKCCEEFVGTHNFHNYSRDMLSKDPKAKRYIASMKVQELNHDFLMFTITGQSFIYHQIRKIIGCIAMVMVNEYPPSFIQNTFFRNQIHMPLAPTQGLFLNGLDFTPYNRKKEVPQPLDPEKEASVRQMRWLIRTHVMDLDCVMWKDWLGELRSNIFHNVQFKDEPKEGQRVEHDE